jgi:ElaB/YqjD/DUF883 family membrane-anchored ribosome-binding protein
MPNAQSTTTAVDHLAERAATKAAQAIEGTKSATNRALDSLQGGVDSARQTVPEAFGRAAAQVEELTRRGMDRARSMSTGVKDQVARAGDQTVLYIKDEPLKAVLIAAGIGAGLALLARALMRRGSTDVER